jgi:hypothetical protein
VLKTASDLRKPVNLECKKYAVSAPEKVTFTSKGAIEKVKSFDFLNARAPVRIAAFREYSRSLEKWQNGRGSLVVPETSGAAQGPRR